MKLIKLASALIGIGFVNMALAGTPIFTITPVTAPPAFIVAGSQATASYQVSINTNKLTAGNALMPQYTSPANIITQYKTVATDCPAGVFDLDFGSSCLLRIKIDATHLTAGQTITGGPVICSNPSAPHFCAQPIAALNIPVVGNGVAALTITPDNITPSKTLPFTITVTNTSNTTVNNIVATPDTNLAATIQSISYTNCDRVAAAANCTITMIANTNSGSGKLTIQGANTQSVSKTVTLVAPLIAVGTTYNFDAGAEPILLLSQDRATWSQGTLPSSVSLQYIMSAVATQGDQSLIIGKTLPDNAVVLTSADNVTWKEQSLSLAITNLAPTLTGLAYGQNQWVIGGYTGNEDQSKALIIYSADGVTWTQATLPAEAQVSNSNISQISCDGLQCIAISGTPSLLTSINGKNALLHQAYKKPSNDVGVNLILTSQDGGKTWQNQTLPNSLVTDFSFTGAAIANGVWVVSGDNSQDHPDIITGQILTSTNQGQSWQNDQGAFRGLGSIRFQNNIWLGLPGLSKNPAIFMSTDNAQQWTTITLPQSLAEINLPLASNILATPWIFVGVSFQNLDTDIYPLVSGTSDIGTTWTHATLPTLPKDSFLLGIN
jgi:hypothetical protein